MNVDYQLIISYIPNPDLWVQNSFPNPAKPLYEAGAVGGSTCVMEVL